MNEIELNNALKYAEMQLTLSTNESKMRFFKTIVSALRAELSRQENAPMTADELVAMDGEPVYIVLIDKTNIADPADAFSGWGMARKSWARIWDANRSDLIHVDHDFCDYGKTWLAYRYEPKGEPNV